MRTRQVIGAFTAIAFMNFAAPLAYGQNPVQKGLDVVWNCACNSDRSGSYVVWSVNMCICREGISGCYDPEFRGHICDQKCASDPRWTPGGSSSMWGACYGSGSCTDAVISTIAECAGSVSEACDPSGDPLFFHDSVLVTPFGPTMIASFSPRNGCTLDMVARMSGFDHFNWINIVTEAPLLSVLACSGRLALPVLDPVPGEWPCSDGWADNLDYYWNELNQNGSSFSTELAHWTTDDRTLVFRDTPSDAALSPTRVIRFSTSLVGVRYGNTYVPLSTFIWETTFNGTVGSVRSLKVTGFPDPGSGSGAAVLIAQGIEAYRIFADGFELGDESKWSVGQPQ